MVAKGETVENEGRLINQVAVVTGAGSGIGRASALRLAREGARIAALDLNADAAASVADAITQAGGTALALKCDVGNHESVRNAVAEAVTQLGEVDILAACAGVRGSLHATHNLTDADWYRTIEVDLSGVYFSVQSCLPSMRRHGKGSIITCGSTSALVAVNGTLAPYRAAKGGVLMLTKAVAVEYAKESIRANCVCPGPIDTDMIATNSESAVAGQGSAFPVVHTPMGRNGTADEIAAVIAFLASSDSSFITGQAIVVDGGMTAE
jgi:NAD(P)-dependent dehydrogenase (short-subunit alcohol dehydrogenase family)